MMFESNKASGSTHLTLTLIAEEHSCDIVDSAR